MLPLRRRKNVMRKKQKLFQLSEANQLLPEIGRRLKQIQQKKESYALIHDELFVHELVSSAERSNGFVEKDDLETRVRDLEQAIEDLAEDVEAIFATGCILRHIEKGRVDFPAEVENKRIFWSWELGESTIRYYRHLKSDFSERILIPARLLKAAE